MLLCTLSILLLSCVPTFAQTSAPTVEKTAGRNAVVVQLEGEINDYSYKDLVRRFGQALPRLPVKAKTGTERKGRVTRPSCVTSSPGQA